MGSDTSESSNSNSDELSVSPLNLAEIRLRLLHNTFGSQDSFEAIEELKTMGAHAAPLVPFLCDMYEKGRLFLSVEDIIELHLNTGNSDPIRACLRKGDHRKCGPWDQCRLLECGFSEVEKDLLEYLWEHWHKSDSPERVQIVKTLGKCGGQKSLEMMEVIRYKLAGSVQERLAKSDGIPEGELEQVDVFFEQVYVNADAGLLRDIRRAVDSLRERLSDNSDGDGSLAVAAHQESSLLLTQL